MKYLYLVSTIAISVLLSSAHANDSCVLVEDGKKEGKFTVKNVSAENPIGYVERESDGSWFVWVNNQGAANETFRSKEQAADHICNRFIASE